MVAIFAKNLTRSLLLWVFLCHSEGQFNETMISFNASNIYKIMKGYLLIVSILLLIKEACREERDEVVLCSCLYNICDHVIFKLREIESPEQR